MSEREAQIRELLEGYSSEPSQEHYWPFDYSDLRFLLAEIDRLREIEEAAQFNSAVIIHDECGFTGTWVAVPAEDAEPLRTALQAENAD